MTTYADRSLTCVECGQSFIFSADDQTYHAEKGYTNEPKRCPSCREGRRQQRYSEGGAEAEATAVVAADTAAAVVVTMQALARCIPSYALTAARTLPFRSGPEATVRSTVVTASRNGAGEHPPHADSRSRRGRRPPPPVPETPLGTGAATASVTWALSAEVKGRAPCVWRATARQLAAAGPEPALPRPRYPTPGCGVALRLPEAVRKITSFAAWRLELTDTGLPRDA